MKLDVWQVDAFTETPLTGNPAAVVFGAGELDDAAMMAVSREMNLSETAFVRSVDPTGCYSVRFFTPRCEIPFGGHPTLATAYAVVRREGWLLPGKDLRIAQRCGIGVVPVEIAWRDGPLLTMEQAPATVAEIDVSTEAMAALLGCPPATVLRAVRATTGTPWLVAHLASRRALDGLEPEFAAIERLSSRLGVSGITAFAGDAARPGAILSVRTFAPVHGVAEDPVCGSGNGSVAAYLMNCVYPSESLLDYRVEQGRHVERPGQVHVQARRDGSGRVAVRVGGRAVRVLVGTLEL